MPMSKERQRKQGSLKSELERRVLGHYKKGSHYSRDNALRACRQFDLWRKEQGYSNRIVRVDPQPIIKEWLQSRLAEGKTPSTVHTDAAGVCCGFGISMSGLDLPKRTVSSKVKSTGNCARAAASRGKAENQGIVRFQQLVGGRRGKLERLTGSDLVRDESGHLCVRFVRDKGGKTQYQRIAPEHEQEVRSYFEEKAPDELLFGQVDRNLDLHGIRAEHARDEYDRYAQICSSEEGRDRMRRELWARFCDPIIGNKAFLCAATEAQKQRQLRKFSEEMTDKPYILRGDNRKTAEEKGRPVEYDRLALLCVSVFALSHWRNEVTVKHYLI